MYSFFHYFFYMTGTRRRQAAGTASAEGDDVPLANVVYTGTPYVAQPASGEYYGSPSHSSVC